MNDNENFAFSTKKRRPGLMLRIPSVESAVQEVPTGQEYDGSSTSSSGFDADAITPLEDIHVLPAIENTSIGSDGKLLFDCVYFFMLLLYFESSSETKIIAQKGSY